MDRVKGFTLLELMIVVAIVAILALVAIPSFTEQARKSKRAEALSSISDIQLRQERWRADNPSYGTLANLFGTSGAADSYNASLNYFNVTVTGADGTGSPTGTAYRVTATRKGDLENDPKCGNFTMTYDAGVTTKGMSSGDVDYCWRQ